MTLIPSGLISEYSMRKPNELSKSTPEDYKMGKLLGKGAYAEVRECVYLPNSKCYAMKVYEKIKLIDMQKKRNTIREIHILEEIDHPNIIHLYNVLETSRNVMLLIELVKGKSLKLLIKDNPCGITEKDYIKLFKQILSAVEYLHQKHIAHR